MGYHAYFVHFLLVYIKIRLAEIDVYVFVFKYM